MKNSSRINSMRAVQKRRAPRVGALIIAMVVILSAFPLNAAANGETESNGVGDYPSGRRFLADHAQIRYGEDSTIPVVTVKTALQTSDGFMWFGGYQGLMRYNGINTRQFTQEDGFPSSNVNALFEDSKNRLWIGTNDSGIVIYENNTFTVIGTMQGLPSALVRDIAECGFGDIYIATSAGIAIYTSEGELIPHPQLGDVPSYSMEHVRNGHLMSLGTDGGIVHFDRDTVIETFEPGHFGDSQPNSIFVTKSGIIYIGTLEDEIYMTDLRLEVHQPIKTEPLMTHNGFFEDSAGNVWVFAENGAGYLSGGRFTYADGLIVNSQITCITEDYEGSYWIGTMRTGLVQLIRTPFLDVNFLARIEDFTANTVAMRNDDLYIGTEEGLIILRDFEPIENTLTGMLNGISVRHLLVDSQNRLWISTADRYGIIMVDNDGSNTLINVADGLLSNQPRVAIESSNGDIYVGLYNGISVIRDGEIHRNYTYEDGLEDTSILSLCEGPDGIIYAGTERGGFYAINGDEVRNYSEKDGLPTGTVYCILATGDGILLSTGDALSFYDGRWIRNIEKQVISGNYIFDMQESDGDIWLLGNNGLIVTDLRSLLSADAPEITFLRKPDGLTAAITAGLWSDMSEDGYLYFCTSLGVFAANTRDYYTNKTMPLSAISEVYADGELLDISNGYLELDQDVSRLSINISLLSFVSRSGTISYMLEGFDDNFITSNRADETMVYYTNLSGGEYTFRLYGTNADGRRSEVTVLPVRKAYTFLEMPIAYVLIVAMAIAVVFVIIRIIILNRKETLERQRQEHMDLAARLMKVAADMSDLKGGFNSNHSLRVAEYSKKVGKRLGLTEDEQYTLYYAALLHDVGMASIPGYIVFKNGILTDEEYEIIKTHTDIGCKLLKDIDVTGDITVGAKYHHERVDGKGYNGFKGDDIPLMGKIIGVCNAFDSMLMDKPYRKALTIEEAQSELLRCAGRQFDEKVTAALISLIVRGEVPM